MTLMLAAIVPVSRWGMASQVGSSVSLPRVPEEFSIELVAGPPLIERPIVGAFDDDGRLYVAESSGSNDPVEKQLEERPHRIVRLEDSDGDGTFDRRVVFADHMMFPSGVMFRDGSLYVAAAPSIWKLTDVDGDGVADERVEWFQGKTLTGCANDLHGPYAGPDGWVYWCKGAFAEQTHIVNGREWKSRAAHIFRCRPDGTDFEPVLTAGMDNPVDVTFTSDGERLLSATYLVGEGRRDGLVHAIYGGVYGKENEVLAGHPRTGDLMPALVLMSPVAPSGIERYDSEAFGKDYRDNLFACQFNLRKVSRHVLDESGSSFVSHDSDFVNSDNVDFHPTDVLIDADGSLLVIDTGGWYKLCCPTSQLWKPEVLGGIYRVRRNGEKTINDPFGRNIDWASQTIDQLWTLLGDDRSKVRDKACREFLKRRDLPSMIDFLNNLQALDAIEAAPPTNPDYSPKLDVANHRTGVLARTWAIVQLENEKSKSIVRQLLDNKDNKVRHTALAAISLHRDPAAIPSLIKVLDSDSAANRRIAAEALGRVGDRSAVPHLLAAAATADDRILQHSITYALIELADPIATRIGLSSKNPRTIATALIAIDQMPDGSIESSQVVSLLSSPDDHLRLTAQWLLVQHAEWGPELAVWFRSQLATLPSQENVDETIISGVPLEDMLTRLASHSDIQNLLAEVIVAPHLTIPARQVALRVMAKAKMSQAPAAWFDSLGNVIAGEEPILVAPAIEALRAHSFDPALHPDLTHALLTVADDVHHSDEMRSAALALVASSVPHLSNTQYALLLNALVSERSIAARAAAAEAFSRATLTLEQLDQLCNILTDVNPLEINRIFGPFERTANDQLGLKLLSSLRDAPALPSLRIDLLRHALANYGPTVQEGIRDLESLVNVDADDQRQRIEELLPLMSQGDIGRGHAVFHSSKASCSACHQLGFAGGTVGPELTRIGEIRTERDLLESILYPSLSFVRSYEPVLILTVDGTAINGRIREETDKEYVLTTGPNEEVRVRREDVEDIQPSTVSVMPAGLDKQLSTQELADLVAFLRNAKGK